jgi:hypothetical protein
MPAANKGAASPAAIPPVKIFDAASKSSAQHPNRGPVGLSSLAPNEAEQYEIATKRSYAACSYGSGMRRVQELNRSSPPSDEVCGEVPRMFESEIPQPDPLLAARADGSGLQWGAVD